MAGNVSTGTAENYRRLDSLAAPYGEIELQPVDWLSPADADEPFGEERTIPPTPVQDRIARMNLRWKLERGDWGGISHERYKIKDNVFRMLTDRMSGFMGSSRVTVSPADDRTERLFNDTVNAAVRAFFRDSVPIFFCDSETGIPEVLDARYWYPTTRGWVYAVPIPSPSREYEEISVMIFDQGVLSVEVYEYTGHVVGNVVGRAPDVLTDDPVAIPAEFDISAFDLIVPHVLEGSERLSHNSTALGKLANPGFVAMVNPQDAQAMASMEDSAGFDSGIPMSQFDTAGQEADRLSRVISRSIPPRTDVAVMDHRIQDMRPLSYDADLGSSFEQIETVAMRIEGEAQVPGLFNNFREFAAPPSGVALRLLNLGLYSTVRSVQDIIRTGMQDCMEAAGSQLSFEWPDVFDVLEGYVADREDARVTQEGRDDIL